MKKKLPTPQKLPSGAWRCQVMANGQRVSVVAETPSEAQARAVAMKAGLIGKEKKPSALTVGEAIDRYIDSKDAVLSPSTIAGYRRIRKNLMRDIIELRLGDLTQEKVQRWVNRMAADKSPKTIRNAHGLLSAALAEYAPGLALHTTMPQKQRYEIAVPSDAEIQKIIDAAAGTVMELPVLLALWFGLRASEIRGITWDAIEGDTLHIKQAIVQGPNGPALKGTKTYSGNRRLRMPCYLVDLIDRQERVDDYIVHLSGQAMYKRFSRLCEKAGVTHYRFHDLRHANASIMLALGVPDKYAMERMGHATNHMLKTVYQHTMREKQDKVSDMVDNYFSKKMHTNLHTKK